METRKRWQDKLNLGLGFWLLVSPLILIEPYAPIKLDLVTSHSFLMGIVIMLVAGAALYQFNVWEEWLETVLGAWLIASPFVLGFSEMGAVVVSQVVVGAIIIADSVWVILQSPPIARTH